MKKLSMLLATLIFALALTGCGGGSGSDSPSAKEVAIKKITAYATGTSSAVPTTSDYHDAGINVVSEGSLARMNDYVLQSNSDDIDIWTQDSDGDGTIDALDDFPNDASRDTAAPVITISRTSSEAEVTKKFSDIPGITTWSISTFFVSPALPAGLSLNANTGAITGAPTEMSRKTVYTVTATNSAGSDSKTFTLAVKRKLPLLLVMVEFSDISFEDGASYWSEKIFGTGNSVNRFYKENSYNQFEFAKARETDGASDGVVKVNIYADYPVGENLAVNYMGTIMDRVDPYIDFSKYDTNKNGKISRDELEIMFLVAGPEMSSGFYWGVWAHADSYRYRVVLDGVRLMDGSSNGGYSMFGERHLVDDYGNHKNATIGVICHELGHATFKFPDLYDVDNSSMGVGLFGLMGAGSWAFKADEQAGETPVHMLGWTKQEAGFIKPTVIKSNTNGVSILEASNINSKVFRIDTSSSNEYFLLENRLGGYDQGLYVLGDVPIGGSFDGGLLITHIDESKRGTGNLDNSNEDHKLVDVVEASDAGLDNKINQGVRTNLFYAENKDTITPSTTPSTNKYNGDSSGISVTNISDAGTTMTFDVIKN